MEKVSAEGTMFFQTMEVELLTPQDIAAILPKVEEIKKWISDVEKKALEVALAGEKIDGYVLSEGRKTRKIANETAVVKTLIELGFSEDKFIERKMVGIPALEKLVGKKDFELMIACYINVEPGKPALVKEKE
jgi:hypothetical protein